MSFELLLRVIGILSLFAAIAYLISLFAPPLPGFDVKRLKRRVRKASERLRDAFEHFAEVGKRLQDITRTRALSPEERGAEMSLIEGYDEAHAERLALSARLLAQAVGLRDAAIAGLVEACYLHDIGALELEGVLTKSAPLSPEEYSRMRRHSIVGFERVAADAVHPEAQFWVRWHHERMDGTGYPDQLVGDEIPLPARILAIADAFEAISHSRPYRQALEPQDALAELRSCAGSHYDPGLVELFTNQVFPQIVMEEPGESPPSEL